MKILLEGMALVGIIATMALYGVYIIREGVVRDEAFKETMGSKKKREEKKEKQESAEF